MGGTESSVETEEEMDRRAVELDKREVELDKRELELEKRAMEEMRAEAKNPVQHNIKESETPNNRGGCFIKMDQANINCNDCQVCGPVSGSSLESTDLGQLCCC